MRHNVHLPDFGLESTRKKVQKHDIPVVVPRLPLPHPRQVNSPNNKIDKRYELFNPIHVAVSVGRKQQRQKENSFMELRITYINTCTQQTLSLSKGQRRGRNVARIRSTACAGKKLHNGERETNGKEQTSVTKQSKQTKIAQLYPSKRINNQCRQCRQRRQCIHQL